jgi:hypothetical protein
MNTTDNPRVEARSRALRRLRRITIGTTILGVASTGAFGLVAAATYDGSGATAVVDTAAITGTTSTATATTSVTATATATTTTTNTSASSAAPTVTSVSGGAHVSTGGS